MANTKVKTKLPIKIYPCLKPEEKLEILRQIKGMWKGKKWNPMKELTKMRKEWERKLVN